ncbi:MAG: hypothetical protein IK016_02540 [Lachnospiraceae bacterium]|nr:hypothetical protein [Lachnospiraceae bacterium]
MTVTRMSWEDMVRTYPDMWVVVANPVMDGDAPDILEGDVVAVVSDDDIGDYKDSHRNCGYKYRRTTDSGWNGMIYADFSITTV